MTESAESLFTGILARDRRRLSRSVSEIVNSSLIGRELARRLDEGRHRAFTIGITGPPGAGKSTLISHLTPALQKRGGRVAVLLVDPSSPVSGGAVLGDRIRFSRVAGSADVFVRSFGSRGGVGGVIAALDHVIKAVAAADFDTVIVETVGAGQSDIAITSTAHCTICAMPPGLGDSIQAIKAGIQEVADLFVVTKGDRPGADQLLRQLRNVPYRVGDDRARPVFRTSATDAEGIDSLADDLRSRYLAAMKIGAPSSRI
ncbi:MAG: methylmalonyl Co-A mutase-associated GTPase MeaB [Mycolicibacterium cosmeticum]|nr:methylmalonyl Co-A mutase-associated GTPase MeaB [Mycolicibacterium cosmeticum]